MNAGGVSFASLLLLLFIVLKLTHVINWSWWWVLAPFWIPLGLVLLLFVGGIFVLVISY
jgi:hypothetical protein